MATNSKIEWTEATLNAVTGCDRVSPGCLNCYAEKMAKRLQAMGAPGYENGFEVTLHPQRILEFLRWSKPRVVFWCSMGDLFHDKVPAPFIFQCLDAAWRRPEHASLFLTKRAARMADLIAEWVLSKGLKEAPGYLWFGVTTENQQAADERIPHLLRVPGKRWLSVEPMLGPVSFSHIGASDDLTGSEDDCPFDLGFIHAVVLGGESGPGARPMGPDWVRSVRDQCAAAGVPFMFKQWGGWVPVAWPVKADGSRADITEKAIGDYGGREVEAQCFAGQWMARVGKKAAGRVLDGEVHDDLPWRRP